MYFSRAIGPVAKREPSRGSAGWECCGRHWAPEVRHRHSPIAVETVTTIHECRAYGAPQCLPSAPKAPAVGLTLWRPAFRAWT